MGKSGESKYDRKPPELDVVTKRIWYRVKGVLNIHNKHRFLNICDRS